MQALVLYCKSYRTDLKRLLRLAESVKKFNRENIPFYVSVPKDDVGLFSSHLAGLDVSLIEDEAIISTNPAINATQFFALPGHISQQVVKAEFWRLGISSSYMCLDSDALFIRSFSASDYLLKDGTPYTIQDECQEFLYGALAAGKMHLIDNFNREAQSLQTIFGRTGKAYSFGPFPLLWHRDVWQSLDTHYLHPKGISILDAIVQNPMESRWYGEALLQYKAIPLITCQALFKVYHYAWQFDKDRAAGITTDQLGKIYSGVILQSAWEREMDWPTEGGGLLSKLGRRIRRKLGRI